jgi:hypothetical protein
MQLRILTSHCSDSLHKKMQRGDLREVATVRGVVTRYKISKVDRDTRSRGGKDMLLDRVFRNERTVERAFARDELVFRHMRVSELVTSSNNQEIVRVEGKVLLKQTVGVYVGFVQIRLGGHVGVDIDGRDTRRVEQTVERTIASRLRDPHHMQGGVHEISEDSCRCDGSQSIRESLCRYHHYSHRTNLLTFV